MSASPVSIGTPKPAKDNAQQPKPRSIHSCNFRYAGRLSNENVRALTALHEKFALNVANSLGLYLGASLRLKLAALEQVVSAEYSGRAAADSYMVPCSLSVMDTNILLEMDIDLIFPIIDLLLGGAGTASKEARELTEIDEEILQSVTVLIVKELERSWRALNLSLIQARCIKPIAIPQVFLDNEKLVLLIFETTLGSTNGCITIVLPTSFVGFLLRHLKAAQSKKVSSLRPLRSSSLRERILDCDFVVSADVTQMRVQVKDLIDLKPGMVLKMKSPVKRPGRLTVEDVSIFEALPVRNGARKAAQLTARLQDPDGTKE
jgi:flagellar motor switch protein FliM